MKTYCPSCGALHEHGLIKPKSCVKCHEALEFVTSSTTVEVVTPRPSIKVKQRPIKRPVDFDEDDEDDVEIPENIATIEIETPRINAPRKLRVGDIAGKKDGSDAPRPIIKISKKKQLQALRDEVRSAREKPAQEI